MRGKTGVDYTLARSNQMAYEHARVKENSERYSRLTMHRRTKLAVSYTAHDATVWGYGMVAHPVIGARRRSALLGCYWDATG